MLHCLGNKELLDDMYKFQKHAARIILDKDFDTPTDNLFSQLNWMKFSDRVNYKKAILVYKFLNNLLPEYMGKLFINTENRSLRSYEQRLLSVPKPRLEFCRKSLAYSGSKLWNSLPLNIRNSTNLQTFKTNYLQRWFSGGQQTSTAML